MITSGIVLKQMHNYCAAEDHDVAVFVSSGQTLARDNKMNFDVKHAPDAGSTSYIFLIMALTETNILLNLNISSK